MLEDDGAPTDGSRTGPGAHPAVQTAEPQAGLRPCPACGSRSVARSLSVREMMFGIDAAFPYSECSSCGTVRLEQVPEDLARYYPSDYYSVDLDPERVLGRVGVRQLVRAVGSSAVTGRTAVSEAAVRVLRRRQFQTLVSLFRSVRLAGLARGQGSDVLDVGCGSGMLVYALSLAGLESVTGVDPFAPQDRRFDTGAQLLRQDLGEVRGAYDLIMFHHSFEHVVDPAETLEQAARLLRPGGRVLVRMPTVSSQAYEDYGSQWVQLDAPRHLTVFSRAGMADLAQSVGMRLVAVQDDSTAFQFWGSEQVKQGIALESPRSHMIDPSASVFQRTQLRRWQQESVRLNAQGRGDQAVWVLEPSA